MLLLLVLVVAVTRWECFIRSLKIKMLNYIGVEAAGDGIDTGKHAAAIACGQNRSTARRVYVFIAR